MTDWRTLDDHQLEAALIAAGENGYWSRRLTRCRHAPTAMSSITRILNQLAATVVPLTTDDDDDTCGHCRGYRAGMACCHCGEVPLTTDDPDGPIDLKEA